MADGLDDADLRDLAALCETILPAGPDGPGAAEAGVMAYIARQLAGDWGHGDRMFRQGPFDAPYDAGHGWQSAMTPLATYQYGLAELREHARVAYGDVPGALGTAQLEELVEAWSSGDLGGFERIPATAFFALVRANVAEGLFSDPQYLGNRDMIGWRWIGYPGVAEAHGGYADLIEKRGPVPPLEPRSLSWR